MLKLSCPSLAIYCLARTFRRGKLVYVAMILQFFTEIGLDQCKMYAGIKLYEGIKVYEA